MASRYVLYDANGNLCFNGNVTWVSGNALNATAQNWSQVWGTAGSVDEYVTVAIDDIINTASREKTRTILDVLSAEEKAEIRNSIASLLEDDENIPAAVKWLVYERLRQRHNAALLERQIEVLRKAASFAPEELADEADAECAALGKAMVRDAYLPAKDGD